MAITKSAAAVFSGVTTSQTSSAVDCSGDYGQQLYVKIGVVGSPSAGATFKPQWSPDGTAYYDGPTFTASTTAGNYYWIVDVPVTSKGVRVVFVAQTGGTSSTIDAQLGQVTAI